MIYKQDSLNTIRIYYGGFISTGGGAYTHAYLLKQAFTKLGFNVQLITLDNIPLLFRFVPHCILYIFNYIKPASGFLLKGKAIRTIYNFLYPNKTLLNIYEDIYISDPSTSNSVTVLHALWSDNLQAYKLPSKSLEYLISQELSILNSFSHPIFTVSLPYKNYLTKDHFKSLELPCLNVIPLGIDLDDVYSYNSSKSYDPYSLCFCGCIEKRKNLQLLLEIFQLLYHHNSQYKLTLIGEGPLRSELSSFASLNNLPVRFTGKLNRSDMLSEVQRHSLMVHTSTKESFSFALLEAKLLGLFTFAHHSLEIPHEFIDVKLSDYDPTSWFESILSFEPERIPSVDLSFYSSSRMARNILDLTSVSSIN